MYYLIIGDIVIKKSFTFGRMCASIYFCDKGVKEENNVKRYR